MIPGKRRYEIQLSSKSGPIDVFLIQDLQASEPEVGESTFENAALPLDFQPNIYNFDLQDHEGPNDMYEINDLLNMQLFNNHNSME